jgi:hypothetical protein
VLVNPTNPLDRYVAEVRGAASSLQPRRFVHCASDPARHAGGALCHTSSLPLSRRCR